MAVGPVPIDPLLKETTEMMNVLAIMAGLLPIMWGPSGSEVTSRIAAPRVGGMIVSPALALGVIPGLYALIKQWQLARNPCNAPLPRADAVPFTATAHLSSATSLHFVNKGTTMNTSLKLSRRIATGLLLSVVLASGAAAQTVTSPELLQKMEAARTRGDYEAWPPTTTSRPLGPAPLPPSIARWPRASKG